jgi:molybdenum cofactor sulfurtransferase
VKYPLRWIQQIKAKSTDAAQWRVLVDAAAYVPTQPLDLREVSPDFVALSFYKMFGYPTVRWVVCCMRAFVWCVSCALNM